ncbi:MAG: Formamidopyrimidine-DNA glycosylase [candidate division WS6 bacterium OLB20]|uniref:Formamidopyrimidine-DNA glycosylase n=1 Tax=candidate division WS6 bacterium OLB20 TaxID=1617426 RepID=A0A136LZ70_9BACT|nr:MAG: Formamidopyrimidine-DNA glycosylase [candidate division WS6 bacterium OLB20]
MPELPEVETVVRQIRPSVTGRTVQSVIVTDGGLRMIAPLSRDQLADNLTGDTITSLERTGKFMQFRLRSGAFIAAHLRMSGRVSVSESFEQTKHNRIGLFLDKGVFNFHSIRRFSTFHYVEAGGSYPAFDLLGPDALSDAFSGSYLIDKLKQSKRPVYSALMDQRTVAGLGNIYVNEVLYAAGVHPLREARLVTKSEAEAIASESRRILIQAIRLRGTTLNDRTYLDGSGEYGAFSDHLNVYGKTGQIVDGSPVERIRIGGRSVFAATSQH